MPPQKSQPASQSENKRAQLEAEKEKQRHQNAAAAASNYSWIDRLAKEMKARREYSDRWGALTDPRLYLGEDGPDSFPSKAPPTKWSAYSIINTPKRNPLSSRPSSAKEYDNFKVTGARHDYLSHNNARHPNHPVPKNNKSKTSSNVFFDGNKVETSSYDCEYGGKFEFDHKSGLYYRIPANQKHTMDSPGKLLSGRNSTIPPSPRTHSQQSQHATGYYPSDQHNHYEPPRLKTATLASYNTISTKTRQHTTTNAASSSPPPTSTQQPCHHTQTHPTSTTPDLSNSRNEGIYSTGRRVKIHGLHPDPPREKYGFPATTNMEYGWGCLGKGSKTSTLEIFGNVSADFAKESWKRAMVSKKA